MSEPDVQLALLADAGPLVLADAPFVTFELLGEPRAWSRPGAVIRTTKGHAYIHWYVREEEAQYREALQWCAKAALRGREPTLKPVALLIHAFMPIPISWTVRERMDARAGAILPSGKPDWDNFGKIMDALKGIVWGDDAAVVDGRVIKRYSDKPALRVEVREYVAPKERPATA